MDAKHPNKKGMEKSSIVRKINEKLALAVFFLHWSYQFERASVWHNKQVPKQRFQFVYGQLHGALVPWAWVPWTAWRVP